MLDLRLRPLEPRDHDTIRRWLTDPECLEFVGGESMLDLAITDNPHQRIDGYVAVTADDQPAAFLTLANSPFDDGLSIAIVVDPDRRDQGIGAETIDLLIIHPDFEDCDFTGEIAPDNKRSIRLFLTAGFGFDYTDDGEYVTVIYRRSNDWFSAWSFLDKDCHSR